MVVVVVVVEHCRECVGGMLMGLVSLLWSYVLLCAPACVGGKCGGTGACRRGKADADCERKKPHPLTCLSL